MIDIEVDGPKLKGETTIFGFIDLPRVPMIRVHKYIMLFLGAAIVTTDLYRQLPSDMSKLDSTTVDPTTWLAFPFILVAYLFSQKQILIKVCRQFRQIAMEEQQTITEFQLNLMVNAAMIKILPMRVFDLFYVLLTWFIMFNFMMVALLYLIGGL